MSDSDTVIRVENLGKCYKLGQTHHYRISDVIMARLKQIHRKFRGLPVPKHPRRIGSGSIPKGEFWALRDVSFEIKRGDVVGVIGLNGAGKSTLFKLLSRITEPTEGQAWMKGRIGSLLEVGTGFHPELTGSENIYLNGAILGMTRAEIKTKFDQIIAFAGIERFIDTPVKRYSSGMYVRLAFAVAAHLEPEILLIDEVLAVGDAAFQHKCLGKMQEVTGEGRTILFVSHNMPSIESLCNWSMVLDQGKLVFWGETEKAISQYLKNHSSACASFVDLTGHKGRTAHSRPIFQSLRLQDIRGNEASIFKVGESILFELDLESGENVIHSPYIHIEIIDSRDTVICKFLSEVMHKKPFEIDGRKSLVCRWQHCRLVPGLYTVKLEIKNFRASLDKINDAISFEIRPTDIYGTGKLDTATGLIVPDGNWEIK